MFDVEPLILNELQRLSPLDQAQRGDWEAVVSRAQARSNDVRATRSWRRGRGSRRLTWIAFAAVLLLIAIAAPALGLGPPFLDFFSSKHASKRVIHQFALLNVGAPRGMSPKVISGQTRLVTTYRLRTGKAFPLWVAPTRAGGFCYLLGYGGGCVAPTVSTHPRSGDLNVGQLDVSRESNVIAGSVANKQTAKVEVRFLHGSAASLPVLWVGPPINRGFYFYDLTSRQRNPSRHPTAVVALSDNGGVLARVASMFRVPPAWFNPNKVSNRADRHVILRSGRLSITTAPSSSGGSCWWLKYRSQTIGSGCAPPRLQKIAMAGGQNHWEDHGDGFTSFSAQVKPTVRRVVLRFQDRATVTLAPVEGHVLYDIPKAHWPRGHRLTVATAYNTAGTSLASQKFDPLQTGVYDCTKTIPIGVGQRACP
jgi:hypothetical protein